jgi:hypothetical protein
MARLWVQPALRALKVLQLLEPRALKVLHLQALQL